LVEQEMIVHPLGEHGVSCGFECDDEIHAAADECLNMGTVAGQRFLQHADRAVGIKLADSQQQAFGCISFTVIFLVTVILTIGSKSSDNPVF